MAYRYMKIYKTTMRCRFTLVKRAIINKTCNNKCWRGRGEKGTFIHYWWECKLMWPLWKAVWRFLRKLIIELLCDQQPLSGYVPSKFENIYLQRYVQPIFISALLLWPRHGNHQSVLQ